MSEACLTVCLGLFKYDDAGFGDRDSQTIEITGVLGGVEEALHVRMEMGDEAEVVDVKKDT
jgi:ethanolamine utilization microcompartment shell protein EutS